MVMIIDYFFVIAIIVGCFGLMIASFLQNHKRLLNLIFSFISMAVGFWIVLAFLSDLDSLREFSLFFNRLLLVGVIGVIFGIFYLSFNFPFEIKIPKIINYFLVFFTVLLSFLTVFSNLTIESVEFLDWGTNPIYGFLFNIFGVYSSILLVISIIRFTMNYLKCKGLAKLQMKYLFFGLFLFMTINIIVHMVISEILGTVEYYKFGNYSAILFVIFLGIAIIKHRLMDIRLVIARSIAYLLLISIFGGLYIFAFINLSNYFFNFTNLNISQLMLSTILSLIIAFSFQPVLKLIERITDNIFFHDRYDSQVLINKIVTIITSTLSVSKMTKEISDYLLDNFNLEKVDFHIVYRNSLISLTKDGKDFEMISKEANEDLAKFINNSKNIYVYDEMNDSNIKKRIMLENELGCVLVLKSKNSCVGIVGLGFKKNGMAYTTQDIMVLDVISKQLGVAVENALQYRRIEQFSQELKVKIKEATIRLKNANEKLKELDKLKDEFLNVAAHELRAPMTAVKGYLSMIEEEYRADMPKEIKDFVDGALEGTEREIRLVNNMLNVSRIEENRLVFKLGKINLKNIVRSVYKEFKLEAENKELSLELKIERKIKDLVRVDEDRIHEVVANFISNAIKYTDNGGVKIEILNPRDNIIRVEIKDTGLGMTEEEKSKLFNKFYRAASSAGKVLGTGLGLYITKLLVEKFGGELGVESEKDEGSTFWFELPVIS